MCAMISGSKILFPSETGQLDTSAKRQQEYLDSQFSDHHTHKPADEGDVDRPFALIFYMSGIHMNINRFPMPTEQFLFRQIDATVITQHIQSDACIRPPWETAINTTGRNNINCLLVCD